MMLLNFQIILWCTVFLAVKALASQKLCIQRDYGHGGTVCVCNSTYCDTVPPVEQVQPSEFVIYISSKSGLRFHKMVGKVGRYEPLSSNSFIINPGIKRQTIHGFGGSFSDATGIHVNSLPDAAKINLLRSYFSDDGIEYNLCRVPMGSTDFSTHPYSYNDGDVDRKLTRFELAPEDYKYKIPLIREALNLTNNNLQLIASVWAAPKWMKTNGEYGGLGTIYKSMYQTWADYFLKFLQLYKSENISFWGITTQNEPNSAILPFKRLSTVAWYPPDLGKWVSNNLGPTLRNSEFSFIKIIAIDDQRAYLPFYAMSMFHNNTASQYVDGIATHWYSDHTTPPLVLTWTHNLYPDKFLISTEACEGILVPNQVLGTWLRGESYMRGIIQYLDHWGTGWIDWNMVLDLAGGPSHIGIPVDAPVVVNASAGEFYKQPMFYAMGHFSKFVPRGSVVIEVKKPFTSTLKIIAFQRPDNGFAIVVYNRKNKDQFANIVVANRTITTTILAKSFSTILLW